MTIDGRYRPLPGTGGPLNRLTAAEARRALLRTKDGFFILFGTIFAGIPALMAAVVVTITVREISLERTGQAATAIIVAKRVTSDDDGSTYRIYYEFAGPRGKTYGGDYSTSQRDYYSKEAGDRLEIRYSAEDPLRSVVAGQRSVPLFWVLPFLSLFLAVGGGFLLVGVRGLNRRLKLYGAGLPVWGQSRGIQEDPSMRVNNRPCRVLEFEYVDHTGRTHVCRSAYLDEKTIGRLEGLETVPVVYLPDRPADADLDLERLQPLPSTVAR